MNGMPRAGGGFVHLELSSLLTDRPSLVVPVHAELGHVFGLAHPDGYGYGLTADDSVMSYNPTQHTQGLPAGPGLGGLIPEQYYEVASNRLAFPNVVFTPAVHSPGSKPLDAAAKRCFLGEMRPYIGTLTHRRSVGCELSFEGQRANGPDAKFYTRA
jgi:hypothetical protein